MQTKFTRVRQLWRMLSIVVPLIAFSMNTSAREPAILSVSPANGASEAKVNMQVVVTFNTVMNPFTINASTFQLRGPGDAVVPVTVSYNAALRQAILTPKATLMTAGTYKAMVVGGSKGVKDIAGNKMKDDYVWSFKKKNPGPDVTPPEVKLTEPRDGNTGISPDTKVVVKFTEDINPATITTSTFQLFDGANQVVPATVSYHEPPMKATLTPLSPLKNSVVYTARLVGGSSGIKDLAGNALAADYTWSFSTPFNIFQPTDAPLNPIIIDQPVEVGVKFTTTADGKILGLRFYKGAGNDGVHTGHLWTSTGTMLAEAVFVNESASGWQQVSFATPVSITAGQVYVASYFSSLGKYGFTNGYFTNSVVNGPIRALANGESGGNGVYAYSVTTAFPVNSFNATNYFVDVVFVPNGTNARINIDNNNVELSQGNDATTVADQKRRNTEVATFEVRATPNPSNDNFRMYFMTTDDTPVSIKVTDISGRLIESREKVTSTGILQLGHNWKNGAYFVEVVQGNQRKVVKMVKTN